MLTRDINYSGIVEELKQEPSHTRALLINTCLCGSAVTQRTHTLNGITFRRTCGWAAVFRAACRQHSRQQRGHRQRRVCTGSDYRTSGFLNNYGSFTFSRTQQTHTLASPTQPCHEKCTHARTAALAWHADMDCAIRVCCIALHCRIGSVVQVQPSRDAPARQCDQPDRIVPPLSVRSQS